MSSSEQKPSGFTVTDRRSFSASGESKEAEAPASAPAESPRQETPRAMPPADFGTFVLSLGSSVIMHLGEVEHPESGKVEKDLAMAKHSIDLLLMLQEKTKGNLSPQEDKLLESLLYDLRLRFVEASKRG